MERTERVILTNMCMIRSGTKVLVEEKITPEGKGIIFPGGHVEEHEPVVAYVVREMQEETGLTSEKPEMCGIKEWINEDGNGVREEMISYLTPLVQGEMSCKYENGIPKYIVL